MGGTIGEDSLEEAVYTVSVDKGMGSSGSTT